MPAPRNGARPAPARNRALGETGMTIVEVAIAAVILVVSGLAILGLVDAASRNDYRATQSQVVNDRLQLEMEKIKELPYDQVALTSAPANSSNASDPRSRVATTTFNVNRSGSPNYAQMVYNGGPSQETTANVTGGAVDPGPTPFQSGNVKGTVYRFVTWAQDSSCGNCSDRWYKHVTVAVALDSTAPGGTRLYQEVQGDLSNPNAGIGPDKGGPGTGAGGNDETPWTFWLTDTACSANGRQVVTADHLAHNTLGDCSNGLQTGSTAGAPDLMFTQAAPIDPAYPSNQQPLYDFATDVEPTQGADQDKGLQEKIPANTISGGQGCLTDITSSSSLQSLGPTPYYYLHKWLSPAIPTGFDTIALDGTGELDLWTETINGAVYPGKICIWLFVRQTSGGTTTDSAAVNLDLTGSPDYFVYSQSSWANTSWAEIHVPLHFARSGGGSVQLPAGSRLGLAFAVERQGTSQGSGLQFVYDHPSFDSRLQVDTRSLLPVF